jgi:hypothetical protein
VAYDAKGRKRVSLRVLYSCEEQCGRTRTSAGDPRARAASRCSLPDFDPERWDPSADLGAAADAEWRAAEIHGVDFELDRDGCPFGWALSPFAQSVAVYMGQRETDSRVRSPSLRLSRRMLRDEIEPEDLILAVEYAEAHEDGAFARFHEVCSRS